MVYEDIVGLWQSHQIETVQDLEQLLKEFKVLFAYHSEKLDDDDEITYEDAKASFEDKWMTGKSEQSRTFFALQNQRICYKYLKRRVIGGEEIDLDLIREIQYLLTAGTYEKMQLKKGERPGEFKKHDYLTGTYDIVTAAIDVEEELTELLEEINSNGSRKPLKAIAYFHAVFERIQPFSEGNGRVSRILLNYWLMIHSYPPIIIFEEDRGCYYDCLRKFGEKKQLEPLVEFFKVQAIKTWQSVLM